VRYYGFLANSERKEKLTLCRALLGPGKPQAALHPGSGCLPRAPRHRLQPLPTLRRSEDALHQQLPALSRPASEKSSFVLTCDPSQPCTGTEESSYLSCRKTPSKRPGSIPAIARRPPPPHLPAPSMAFRCHFLATVPPLTAPLQSAQIP
jgi:hypothetical protein